MSLDLRIVRLLADRPCTSQDLAGRLLVEREEISAALVRLDALQVLSPLVRFQPSGLAPIVEWRLSDEMEGCVHAHQC